MGIDRRAVQAVLDRARRDVDEGLLPSAQVALAYDGELVAFETFGDATNDTRYLTFSAVKGIVSGAMWSLIGDGLIDVARPVAEIIPGFGTNGKDAVTIEHVMLHTSGFPLAPLHPLAGDTGDGRRKAFEKWTLDWPPGSNFVYHPLAAHWVLAELIEQVTGLDYRDAIEARITGPLGLPRLLGSVPHRAARLQVVGDLPTADELEAVFGVRELPVGSVGNELLLALDDPEVQRIGLPGGGGVMRAADLALYYQAVLHNPGGLWDAAVLADAKTNVRNHYIDGPTGVPVNRTLGLVLAGDDGNSHLRGMGRTVSPAAVGHNGAMGQIAWGDPVSGISLGYCTNGLDQHAIRQAKRTTALGSLAGACATP